MSVDLELRLRMFGPVEIGWRQTPLLLKLNQKELVLFCYLKRNGRFFSRREIEVAFWPDKPKPQVNLRVALNHLRKAGLAPFLQISEDALSFNQQSPHWSDIDALEEQLYLAKNGTVEIKALMHAVDAYRGDFLASVPANLPTLLWEWILKEREYWVQMMIEALDRLLALCIEQSLPQMGIHYGKWLLRLAPWHVRAQKNLAKCEMAYRQLALEPLPYGETAVSQTAVSESYLDTMQENEVLTAAKAMRLLCDVWNISVDEVDSALAQHLCGLLAYRPLPICWVGRSLMNRPPHFLPRFIKQLEQECAAIELSYAQAALHILLAGLKPVQRQLFELAQTFGKRPFATSDIAHQMGCTSEEIQDDLDLLHYHCLLSKDKNGQLITITKPQT